MYNQVFIDFEHPAVMRAMILHILEHAHVQGTDLLGRSVMHFEFPIEDWMIDGLARFDMHAIELEFEPDDEEDYDTDESLVVDA